MAVPSSRGVSWTSISNGYKDSIARITNDNTTEMIHDLAGQWFGYTLGSIIVISSCALLGWAVRYRDARVVRASQPIFLILIAIGSMFFGATLLPLSRESCGFDESFGPCDRACMAAPWFSIMGWTLLFSGIYAKLRRVRVVVQSAQRFRRVTIGYRDVLLPFFFLFSFNFAALLTSTIFFPLRWKIIMKEDEGESYYYGDCYFEPGKEEHWGSGVFIILGVLNTLALVLVLVEAFRGRNVVVEYNESRYIVMAILCSLEIMLVGLPILVMIPEQRDREFSLYISSIIIFAISMSFLLCLFVPKMWAHYHAQRSSPVNTTLSVGLSIQERLDTSTVREPCVG